MASPTHTLLQRTVWSSDPHLVWEVEEPPPLRGGGLSSGVTLCTITSQGERVRGARVSLGLSRQLA